MTQITKLTSLGLLLVVAGCSRSYVVDAERLAEQRSRLVLTEEPDGIQTVADVRTTLLGDEMLGEGHDHDGDGHPDHPPGEHVDAASEHPADAEHGEEHEEHAHHETPTAASGDHDASGHDAEGAEDHEGHQQHGDDTDGNREHGGEGHVPAVGEQDAAHATESIEVAMIGHVGGLANPWTKAQPDYPFSKTQAILFVADPQAVVENEASGHSHAPGEECAYCAAHAADRSDMLAMVQFVDKKGDVLPMDARQLFDVKEQDMVVVRGLARVTAGGILVVDADGLYIRR